MDEALQRTCRHIAARCGESPFDLAVVLGSGLGRAAAIAEDPVVIPYEELECFPRPRVAGHFGRLSAGRFNGRRVLFFQGRFHCYQGLSARQAAIPVRLAGALGCRRLILTNAAGGIDPALSPGDFLFVEDHLNVLGDNPLKGETVDPFIDLTRLYSRRFYKPLRDFAAARGIGLGRGILAAVPGPTYETPAEVRALGLMGAAAVSMSTVPEAIMAAYLGMEVVALSFIANRAARFGGQQLTHQEVLRVGEGGAGDLGPLLGQLIRLWGERPDIS